MSEIRRNQECLCGSGKKYKHCCARKAARRKRLGYWITGGLIAAVIAGLVINEDTSNSSRIDTSVTSLPRSGQLQAIPPGLRKYTEMPEIDLSRLTAAQKRAVLSRANRESCTCGCGFTVAGCRNGDTACRVSVRLANNIVAEVASK